MTGEAAFPVRLRIDSGWSERIGVATPAAPAREEQEADIMPVHDIVAALETGSPPPRAPGTLFLLCGLPGAGKTTMAGRLVETWGALAFAEDVWINRLYGPGAAHDEAKREAVKAIQWDIARDALCLGANVVLDWGFWARSERDDFAARAAAIGAPAVLIYLTAPLDELWRRLAARNAALPPDTFPVTRDQLHEWSGWFTPPAPDEAAWVNAAPHPVSRTRA